MKGNSLSSTIHRCIQQTNFVEFFCNIGTNSVISEKSDRTDITEFLQILKFPIFSPNMRILWKVNFENLKFKNFFLKILKYFL